MAYVGHRDRDHHSLQVVVHAALVLYVDVRLAAAG